VRPPLAATVIGALLSTSPALAAPCSGGRFVVRDGGLVTRPAPGAARALVLGGGRLELEDLCGAGQMSLVGSPRRARLRARWRACPGLGKRVRLRARLEFCDRITGTLHVRQPPLTLSLVATRTRCGDGIVDPVVAEECDDGGTQDGDGCSLGCRLEFCGDGIVQPLEECDDGNLVGGDGCDDRCGLEGIYQGGGDERQDDCFMHWGVSGAPAGATVTCRDGQAACDLAAGAGICTFRYFLCFNNSFVIGDPTSPCTQPSVARVALADESLQGPTALAPADRDAFLAMLETVLGRRATVTRDATGVSVAPPLFFHGLCGGATLEVPTGAERTLAAVETSGHLPPVVDADRMTFRCRE
jgi:cysteine-rich repeat protein